MPRHDPLPSPSHSALRKFRRAIKYMAATSLIAAVLAVVLVAWGSEGRHIHMLIATALGVGFSVFLATALMSLVFLSSSSGQDAEASRFEEQDEQ